MATSVSSGRPSRTTICRPLEAGQVEGVQRLAAFHQHVVRDVDDVVDRRDAHGRQPARPARPGLGRLSPPESRGPYSGDKAGGIRCARLASVSTVGPGPADPTGGSFNSPLPQHRHFPGHADMPQAIGPVAGHFQIDGQIAADLLVSSWFSPASISRRSSSAAGMSSCTYCFNQFQETIMASCESWG